MKQNKETLRVLFSLTTKAPSLGKSSPQTSTDYWVTRGNRQRTTSLIKFWVLARPRNVYSMNAGCQHFWTVLQKDITPRSLHTDKPAPVKRTQWKDIHIPQRVTRLVLSLTSRYRRRCKIVEKGELGHNSQVNQLFVRTHRC